MTTLIYGGHIVDGGREHEGSLVISGDRIALISEDSKPPRGVYDREVDATGCLVMPGVIDEHVHLRTPGLTHKADMESESRAAAWGGVTTYFDMPNTVPQTTTPEALADKLATARRDSHVNYAFFPGATAGNARFLESVDTTAVPGIKLFMGASTGNMLVDGDTALDTLFSLAARRGLPLMTHCEDTALIDSNMAEAKARYGSDPDIRLHPLIRSAEACYRSTVRAVALAHRHHTRLHVAHVSTARELELFGHDADITAEATVAHLLFSDADYATLGTRIKCNPAVKTAADREALRRALTDGRIATIGTDHAPHLIGEKQGGAGSALSGMPMIQYSLPAMLALTDEGTLSRARMVELMCHRPATLFGVRERGYLREGYKADIAIVKAGTPWTVTRDDIQSKCAWSPVEGRTFGWRVMQTYCNGHPVYDRGRTDNDYRGEAVRFR